MRRIGAEGFMEIGEGLNMGLGHVWNSSEIYFTIDFLWMSRIFKKVHCSGHERVREAQSPATMKKKFL